VHRLVERRVGHRVRLVPVVHATPRRFGRPRRRCPDHVVWIALLCRALVRGSSRHAAKPRPNWSDN
jgi:hypothetical protein